MTTYKPLTDEELNLVPDPVYGNMERVIEQARLANALAKALQKETHYCKPSDLPIWVQQALAAYLGETR